MSSKFSRRTFLKLGGAGLAIPALTPISKVLGTPALLQPSNQIAIGINAWVESLDSQTQLGPSNIGYRLYGLMHDSLTHIGHNGQPQPLLATEWENDGMEWRFQLREGVVFHDGSTMTADDVVFSFNRILNPEFGGIGVSLGAFIASVEKVDDLEVAFTTNGVDPLLPYRLSNYWLNIMPQAAVEATDFDTLQTQPIGAGPYKVVEFTPDRLVVERHSEYWGGTPAASEIIVRYIPENAIRVGALQSGEVDLITNVPIDQLDTLESEDGIQVASTPLFNFISVLFNTKTGPTADVNIRRALSLAIDRELIVSELFNGRTRAMTDYLLPGALGYREDRPVFPFDPDAAMAALEEAGYAGEPISFTPISGYYVNSELVTQVVNELWQAIGVTTEFAPMEAGAYGQAYFTGGVTSTIQSFDSFGDPQQTFFEVWRNTDSSLNFFREHYFQPPAEFDEIMENLGTELDRDARIAGIHRMADIFHEQVPLAPIYQTTDYFAMRDGINWQPHPLFYVDLRPDNFSLES